MWPTRILFIVCAQLAFAVTAQADDSLRVHGKPKVIHYTKSQINSNSQFWTMCQDADGILYFGNNDGVVIFDGERWQKVRLPNSSSARALAIGSGGVVYVGGYNEFGTITRDSFGKYSYQSLNNRLRSEDRNFENVWQIHELHGTMVFRTHRFLIALTEQKAITLPAVDRFDYSNIVHDQLFAKDGDVLKRIDLTSLNVISSGLTFNGETLGSVLPGFGKYDYIIITKKGTVFKVDSSLATASVLTRLIQQPSNNLAISALKGSNGKYYVGTLSTQMLSFYNTRSGIVIDKNFPTLQDNTVLNLFEGKEGNIWALLNDGLDCIEVSSPMSALFEDASVYDVILKNNKLFIATNLGVFQSSTIDGDNSPDIRNIIGLEGQAWTLHDFEGQLLCSHDQGLFQISGNKILPILKGVGIWKTLPVTGKPGYYLACAYEGIYLVTFDRVKGFQAQHRLEGFNESSRDILQGNEPGVFWICHGYKGVFKIKIEDTFHRVVGVEHFRDKNGIPSPFNINVFRWKNEPVFTTNNGIFTFDSKNKRFIPHTFLSRLFGTDLNVRKLIQHGDKTWFIHDDEAGYFLTNETNPVLHKGMFRELKGTFNSSLECIYPINATQVMMGSNMGLHYFDLSTSVPDYPVKTIISNVTYKEGKDDVTGSLAQNREQPFQFAHAISTITFYFSAPAVQQKTNVQYSCMLEGVDEEWSAWQESPMKAYSILRPGKYAFHVKAQTRGGEQADEAIYYFEILPVWYQTQLAILGYVLFAAGIIVLMVFWVRRKIHRAEQKTRDEEQQKRNVLELIIERIKLERENTEIKKDKGQLEQDILHKSKELANHTNILIRKRELLGDLQEELKSLMDMVKNDPSRQKIRELIRRINIDQKDEEHIRVFESNFEKVHYEFFEELKAFFPDLTPKELQLCAFVKMNLGNKEIALIQNITVRGVETARYRIRKKLNLKPEEDLVAFFQKLHTTHQAALDQGKVGDLSQDNSKESTASS